MRIKEEVEQQRPAFHERFRAIENALNRLRGRFEAVVVPELPDVSIENPRYPELMSARKKLNNLKELLGEWLSGVQGRLFEDEYVYGQAVADIDRHPDAQRRGGRLV